MLLSREIRRKIAALGHAHPEAEVDAEEETGSQPPQPVQVVTARRQLPPGGELSGELGPYFSARFKPCWTGKWATQVASAALRALTEQLPLLFAERHQVAFIDIETTGLSSMPLFLVGVLHVGTDGAHIHQFLARDYTEEAAVLAATADLLSLTQLLVSFNGRSFDIPYIHNRLRYHRLAQAIEVAHHWDVLLTARRLLKTGVPDRCLQTLELHLCGRQRGDDIPSHLIPRAYHDYVASGDDSQVAVILYHNQVDLLTTAELAARWAEHAPVPAAK